MKFIFVSFQKSKFSFCFDKQSLCMMSYYVFLEQSGFVARNASTVLCVFLAIYGSNNFIRNKTSLNKNVK